MGGGSGPSENPRYIPLNLRTSDGDTVDTVIKQDGSRQFPLTGDVDIDIKPMIVSSDGGSFMNVNFGQYDILLGLEIKFVNYTDAAPALEFTQNPADDILVPSTVPVGGSNVQNIPKGWKFITASGSDQTINWQGNTFTLSPYTVYYVGYGSDGKPIITTTEDDLVVLADSFTRARQFQGFSSDDFTTYVDGSFDTAAGPFTIVEGENKAISYIPGTPSMEYDLQAGDELNKDKISVTRTPYNNMDTSYNDGTNVENKLTYTDSSMTKPINVTTAYTTGKECSLYGYTCIAAVTNGQDICSSLIVTGTYAQKETEGVLNSSAQYITAGVIGDSSNQSAISYTDTSDAGKIDVAADELDLDISFTF